MEQHCLLSNSQRADQVSGSLDEKVFKGWGGMMRWIRDDLEHANL